MVFGPNSAESKFISLFHSCACVVAMDSNNLPSQKHFWSVVVPRIEKDLLSLEEEVRRLIGLYVLFGPRDVENFSGDAEGKQLVAELTRFLILAMAHELEARMIASESPNGPGVGRPMNHMIRYLGPELVGIFLRYQDSGGRHSILTSSEGRLTQMEAGPLFEFAKTVLVVLNQVLVEELHLRPLSPARVIRYGLAARKFRAPDLAGHRL